MFKKLRDLILGKPTSVDVFANTEVEFDRHARDVMGKRFSGQEESEFFNIPEPYLTAHKATWKNRKSVESSKECGCFYCGQVYSSTEISEYHDEGETAFCPKCGIDAIIPSSLGYPLTKEFLEQMNKYWFGYGFVPLGSEPKG